MSLTFAAQILCETARDSQRWHFWEHVGRCQEPGVWALVKPQVTSKCMDMTLQEIPEICHACAYFPGQ